MLKQPSIAGIFPLKNPLLKPKQDEIKKPKIKEQKVCSASSSSSSSSSSKPVYRLLTPATAWSPAHITQLVM